MKEKKRRSKAPAPQPDPRRELIRRVLFEAEPSEGEVEETHRLIQEAPEEVARWVSAWALKVPSLPSRAISSLAAPCPNLRFLGSLHPLLEEPLLPPETKGFLAETLLEAGIEIDPHTMEKITFAREALAALRSSCLEGRREGLGAVTEKAAFLPADEQAGVLRSGLAQNWGEPETYLEWIEPWSEEEQVFLLESLRGVATEIVERLMERLASAASSKAVQRAARRVLFVLRGPRRSVESRGRGQSVTLQAQYQITLAKVSFIDGKGNRVVCMAKTKAGGGLHFIYYILSDAFGVLQCVVSEPVTQWVREFVAEQLPEEDFVDLDPDYCIHLIRDAAARNADSGTTLPDEHLAALNLLGNAGKEFSRPLIHELSPIEALSDVQGLVARSASLFEDDRFASWYLPEDHVKIYQEHVRDASEGMIIVSPALRAELAQGASQEAIEDIFDEPARGLYQRRLEEMALFLHIKGNQNASHMALAVSAALADSAQPPIEIPFIRELIRRSIPERRQRRETPGDEEEPLIVVP